MLSLSVSTSGVLGFSVDARTASGAGVPVGLRWGLCGRGVGVGVGVAGTGVALGFRRPKRRWKNESFFGLGVGVGATIADSFAVVAAGVSFGARNQNPGSLVANGANLFRIDPKHYRADPASDAEGRISFPDLIPGATYRIDDGGRNSPTRKEMSVKPGETLDLGDIPIERPTPGK